MGTRFRLHGRDPATGLDCVGLAALAVAAAGIRVVVPSGYGLRSGDPGAVAAVLDGAMRRSDGEQAGDLLLVRPGPGQLHLGIRTGGGSGGGLVHADLGLGRVVERPGAVAWPVIGAWRGR